MYYKKYLKRYFLEFLKVPLAQEYFWIHFLFLYIVASALNIKVGKKYFYSAERTVVKYYDSMKKVGWI